MLETDILRPEIAPMEQVDQWPTVSDMSTSWCNVAILSLSSVGWSPSGSCLVGSVSL